MKDKDIVIFISLFVYLFIPLYLILLISQLINTIIHISEYEIEWGSAYSFVKLLAIGILILLFVIGNCDKNLWDSMKKLILILTIILEVVCNILSYYIEKDHFHTRLDSTSEMIFKQCLFICFAQSLEIFIYDVEENYEKAINYCLTIIGIGCIFYGAIQLTQSAGDPELYFKSHYSIFVAEFSFGIFLTMGGIGCLTFMWMKESKLLVIILEISRILFPVGVLGMQIAIFIMKHLSGAFHMNLWPGILYQISLQLLLLYFGIFYSSLLEHYWEKYNSALIISKLSQTNQTTLSFIGAQLYKNHFLDLIQSVGGILGWNILNREKSQLSVKIESNIIVNYVYCNSAQIQRNMKILGFIYSTTSPASLAHLELIFLKLSHDQNLKILIGLNSDSQTRKVSYEEGTQFAQLHNLIFFEISDNIEATYKNLIKYIFWNLNLPVPSSRNVSVSLDS